MKDAALEQLQEENEIIKAQRTALENQLAEINKSAGLLRQSLSHYTPSPPPTLNDPASTNFPRNDGVAGNDPVLVAQVVMLENANKVLESNVNSLRSDMKQKLAPLLERIESLEEEKRILAEEMKTKLECREMTISNLENSLQQLTYTHLHASTKKKRRSKHLDLNKSATKDTLVPGSSVVLKNEETQESQSADEDSNS